MPNLKREFIMDQTLMQAMHQSRPLGVLGPGSGRTLRWRASEAGTLIVHGSALWVTRTGGGDDLVLTPGEGLSLHRGDEVVAETWRADGQAQLHWQAEAQGLRPHGFWEALARGAEAAACVLGRLADWARAHGTGTGTACPAAGAR